MKILAYLCRQKEFYSVFCNIGWEIIKQIVLPLTIVTPQEYQSFTHDPSEFACLVEDTCEKQTFECLKTQSANLLEAIVDDIDGMTTQAFNLCLSSLQSNFGLKPPIQNPLSKEHAFIILTIMSCQISARPDLLDSLRTFLSNSTAIISQLN